MSDVLDLRGLSCPRPVMEVRKVLQHTDASIVKALVDSPVARDNIGRTAQSLGWNMTVDEGEDGFLLVLERIT